MEKRFSIAVSSFEGVRFAEKKVIDPRKDIHAIVTTDGRILQYDFPSETWTVENALAYILKKDAEIICQSFLPCSVIQNEIPNLLPQDRYEALKQVDPNPYFGVLRVNYGLGSNNQHFDEGFFQKAGHKFETKPFLWNHSDLSEFGKAKPIGSIVKFMGTRPEGAEFAYYLSASEDSLRQKFRESKALGDFGFIKKVSIEGIPSRSDYTEKEGVKHFHDLTYPTGIAVVLMEGLKGSQIIL